MEITTLSTGVYDYSLDGAILKFNRIEDGGGFMASVCIDLDTMVMELEANGVDYELVKPEWLQEDGSFCSELIIKGISFMVIYTDYEPAGDRGFIKVECCVFSPYKGGAMDGGSHCLANYLFKNTPIKKFAGYIISKYKTGAIHQSLIQLSK